MKNIILTKTPFKQGTQCQKAIWLYYHRPQLKKPLNEYEQMIVDKGTQVGILARELYPDGVDLTQGGSVYGSKLYLATQEALKQNTQVFYEAGFKNMDENMACVVDILVRCNKNTKLIEVKSSTSLKEPDHLLDLAFQYNVFKNSEYSGPNIEVYIAYLNNEYVRGKELDIDELFHVENVTRKIQDAQVLIDRYLQQFQKTLNSPHCPTVNVGEACFKPYKCPFFDHCWRNMPETTVFNISRLRKAKAAQLLNNGIVTPDQVPDTLKLTSEQWVEISAYTTGKQKVNRGQIKLFLDTLNLRETTYWMDFESFMPPIPQFEGSRSYQQICFQYSVLKRLPNGKIVRREFLAEPGKDPRREFIKRLLQDTESDGTVVVYNATFEITRLKELSNEFPEYAQQIRDLIDRIKDLYVPFNKKHYYHPNMKGSASIKAVLPILVPELSYKNLSIQNGVAAMNLYEQLPSLPIEEQIEIKRGLLEYCHLDTLAMIKIVEALQKLILT